MNPYINFYSKGICIIFGNGTCLFGILKSEIYFIIIYFGIRYVVLEILKPSFADYSWLREHIIWTFRLFLALDLRLFRGKMNFQKIEKT